MQNEDVILQTYIEKCRLEKWYEGALELSKSSVQEEFNEETEKGQYMKDIAKELANIEFVIANKAANTAADMLSSKPGYPSAPALNRSAGSLRSSIRHS